MVKFLSILFASVLITSTTVAKTDTAGQRSYKLIQSTDDLTENALYVLAFSEGGRALSNIESANNRPATEVEISDDNILTISDDTMLISLTQSGSGWIVCGSNYPGEAKYFTYANNMHLPMGNFANAHVYNIYFSGQNAVVETSSGTVREIRFNPTAGYFRHNDSASSGTYPIQMYRQITDSNIGSGIMTPIEDASIAYYNLQGLRIEQPGRGETYIFVKGKETGKIRF